MWRVPSSRRCRLDGVGDRCCHQLAQAPRLQGRVRSRAPDGGRRWPHGRANVTGPNTTVAWKLHPPVLRAMGMKRKISVGEWAEPGIRLLAKGKRLRGTRFDPFGRAEVRRIERSYPASIETRSGGSSPVDAANLDDGGSDRRNARRRSRLRRHQAGARQDLSSRASAGPRTVR